MRVSIVDQGSYRQCVEALEVLPGRIRFRHMRIALNAGAGVIKNIAASRAPKETGTLGKSQAVKVRIPDASYNSKHHGKPAYAVIGTKRKFVRLAASIRGATKSITVRRIAKISTAIQLRRPARYAHVAGPGRKSVFMQQAAQMGGIHAQRRMLKKLEQGAYEEARKLAQEAGV